MRFLILFALMGLIYENGMGESPVRTQGEPQLSGKVSETVGAIRWRRRHENDMDFAKYNPFYWQGRLSEFTIRDFSSAGQKRLEVELRTEWPQDYIPTRGPDFSAVYTGDPNSPTEHLRSKFLFNIRTEHVRDRKVFKAVLDEGAFNVAGLKPGQILTMEFRSFMDESFLDWKAQKAKNPNNISSYYSEFIRIKLGEPGLVIDNPIANNKEAPSERYSGGSTTGNTSRVEPWASLQQQATNISPSHTQAFLFGRTWTHTDFTSGEHVQEENDDKNSVFFDGDRIYRSGYAGSAYNAKSCVGCHKLNGGDLLPDVGQPVNHTVLRTADLKTFGSHGSFGSQVQTDGANSEGTVKIARWEKKTESFEDGTKVELKKPIFEISGPLSQANLGFSPRRPMSFIGLGLLEAIPDSKLREWAASNKGTLSTRDGKIGRFGWKAERLNVREQIASAMNTDLAVKLNSFRSKDCSNGCKEGKGILFDDALNDMEIYVSLLAVPPRMDPTDYDIKRGRLTFSRIGCADCHIPSVTTGDHKLVELANQSIQPFTDLLLHDLGPGLEDGISNDLQRKWRTAPLWGLKNTRASTNPHVKEFQPGNVNLLFRDAWKIIESNSINLLHDGRASTLEEAILWHSGEGEASKNAYKKLGKQERDELHQFIWDL